MANTYELQHEALCDQLAETVADCQRIATERDDALEEIERWKIASGLRGVVARTVFVRRI